MCRYLYFGTIEIASYTLFNSLALLAGMICNIFMYKHKLTLVSIYSKKLIAQKQYTLKKCTILEILIITAVQYFLGALCNSILAKITVGAGANYFGTALFSPFLVILFLWIIRVNPIKQLDLFTPSYAIILVFFKLACFMHGCCEGKPSMCGLYYPCRQQYEIPSQLIELFVAFMIFLVLLYIINQRHHRIPGTMFPIYLILYSFTRFITEFTRCNIPIFWQLQPYHFYCITGILIGTIELLLMLKYGQRISDFFDKKINENQI